MNSNDIKLIFIIIIVSLLVLLFTINSDDKYFKKAVVYYENDKVLEIDLTLKEEKYYEVDGYNGKVKLFTKDGSIKVIEEKSPLHICSNMGYISKSYESIVCLPNKVVVKIEALEDIDTIVR